jgi:predicted transcriptional regulator
MVNKIIHPQELAVWYIIPSLRREIAMEMKSRGIEQKKIAAMLGITEPAISQYTSHKRASEIRFNTKIKEEIKNSVDKIIEKKSSPLAEIQRIMGIPELKEILCSLHKKSGGISKNCKICLKLRKSK